MYLPPPPFPTGEEGGDDGRAEEEEELEDEEGEDYFSGTSTDFAARAKSMLKDFQNRREEDEEEEEVGESAGNLGDEAEELKNSTEEEEAGGNQAAEEEEVVKEDRVPTVWSDFLGVRLKEQSYCEVPVWDLRNGSFSSFSAGDMRQAAECALPVEWRDDALDRIRLQLEDCDHTQGFNLTLDASGGFGGLATSLASEARDQCRSAAIHATMLVNTPSALPTDSASADEGVFGGSVGGSKRAARRSLDQALTLHSLLEYTSLLLPLSCTTDPDTASLDFAEGGEGEEGGAGADREADVRRRGEAILTESARLALCLDTATLPYRLGASSAGGSGATTTARVLGMREWVSALSPRADLRVLSCFAHASFSPTPAQPPARLVLSPLFPSVLPSDPSSLVTHWSRVLVGRGFPVEQWSDDRARCFAYTPAVELPRSFPRTAASLPQQLPLEREKANLVSRGGADTNTTAVSVSLGCNSAIFPWLESAAEPLRSSAQAAAAARLSSNMNLEDSSAIAESLTQLSDAYSC
jgi:hypothetical protein